MRTWLAVFACIIGTAPALADDPDNLRPFSPDRPGKAHSAITVDPGVFQVESDFVNYTYDQTPAQTSETTVIGAPLLKLGVTPWADLEAGFSLYDISRVRDRTTGRVTTAEGFGDMTLGSKINLLGDDGGDDAVALLPFIKLPTAASGIGNGAVEYTLAIPYNRSLPDNWALILEPQFGLLKNVANTGYHADLAGVVTLSHPLFFDTLTASVELYDAVSGDRHNKGYSTFDPSLAWLVTPNLQLDLGVYIGLNDAAPDVNPYGGITYRF